MDIQDFEMVSNLMDAKRQQGQLMVQQKESSPVSNLKKRSEVARIYTSNLANSTDDIKSNPVRKPTFLKRIRKNGFFFPWFYYCGSYERNYLDDSGSNHFERSNHTRDYTENVQAMRQASGKSSRPSPSLAEPERLVESSSEAFSAKHVEMPSLTDALKQPTNSDAQFSSLQESQQLLTKRLIVTTPSPTLVASSIEHIDKDGIQLLLRLENTHLSESIFVGAIVHAIPSENIEFYFFNAKDMAICVGVGLPQAKVNLHNDLSITIEETTVSEKELKDKWMPLFSDKSCHLLMKVKMEVSGMQVNGDDNVQTFAAGHGETLSRLHGVGFEFGSQYVDETYDAAELSWPLLYDMARFIWTKKDLQCNETNEESSAHGSGSFQGNINMVRKLDGKCNSLFKSGKLQGGLGDGNEDEDGLGCDYSALEEDDSPPVVLKLSVNPLPKCDFVDTPEMPDGLDGAAIAPKLVFEFRRNRQCRRISIKSQTHLGLASTMDVFCDTELFGWYHTEIQISFGCEDHEQSGRGVAYLDQNSCRILNEKTSYKYTTANSIISTKANTHTSVRQAGINVRSLIGVEIQGSSSRSGMEQEAANSGENIEMIGERICGGFSFRNSSRAESPALASFCLSYPIRSFDIWNDRDRDFLQFQGLFSTIEPWIEGTWIPLNEHDVSPYIFKVERSLKIHERPAGLKVHKQKFCLPFYVNHAMTHLKRKRSEPTELYGDQQSIPDVVRIGSLLMTPPA